MASILYFLHEGVDEAGFALHFLKEGVSDGGSVLHFPYDRKGEGIPLFTFSMKERTMAASLFTFSMAPLFTFSMKTNARCSALHFLRQRMDELRTASPIVQSFFEEVRTEPPSSTQSLGRERPDSASSNA